MLFEGDPDPTPLEGLVTVGRFQSPVEAQIAKGILDSAGVECFLVGENANNLLQAAFRVRLQVREQDEDAALTLLAQTSGEAEAGALADGS
jgi:hypothetical protein